MGKKEQYTRPENLLEALGIDYKALTEDERTMQKLLVERYKEEGKSFIDEIKKWRESNPDSSFGDAIQALYKELE